MTTTTTINDQRARRTAGDERGRGELTNLLGSFVSGISEKDYNGEPTTDTVSRNEARLFAEIIITF
jgi:hypothetical protein